jgi:hypothetical protein
MWINKSILMRSVFAISILILISCQKEKFRDGSPFYDTIEISNSIDFLYNIPVISDTVFMDQYYYNDLRVDIEGYIIDSVIILIDNGLRKFDTAIINTKYFGVYNGLHTIKFFLLATNLQSGESVFFSSAPLTLIVLENFSQKFINFSNSEGRLKILWPEFDKKHTNYYLIERMMGEDLEFQQQFETNDSVFIDDYYVGEEVVYKISVINNEGGRQNIWKITKNQENPICRISQDPNIGYNVHFSSCGYYNNFGLYNLNTGNNANHDLLFTSSNITDTIYHNNEAKYADEGRFWLVYFPKQFPEGVTEENWQIYRHFLFSRYGEANFEYYKIAKIDNERVFYTKDYGIYERNLFTDKITDSIINEGAEYTVIATTPAGDFLYASDHKIYDSPMFFWNSDAYTSTPNYTLNIDFVWPMVSDNLIAIMSNPDNDKWALYNVTNGTLIYNTPYTATSIGPRISSNGEYMFLSYSQLRLCRYANNTFTVIWEEEDWTMNYQFFNFNPYDDNICYLWNQDDVFMVKNTSDFSDITSFTLDLSEIMNIDYYTEKIMGYKTDKIIICSLIDGEVEKEIPSNLFELHMLGDNTILIGNTIYSNGIKYAISNNK